MERDRDRAIERERVAMSCCLKCLYGQRQEEGRGQRRRGALRDLTSFSTGDQALSREGKPGGHPPKTFYQLSQFVKGTATFQTPEADGMGCLRG